MQQREMRRTIPSLQRANDDELTPDQRSIWADILVWCSSLATLGRSSIQRLGQFQTFSWIVRVLPTCPPSSGRLSCHRGMVKGLSSSSSSSSGVTLYSSGVTL